jgi:hypothetical protein
MPSRHFSGLDYPTESGGAAEAAAADGQQTPLPQEGLTEMSDPLLDGEEGGTSPPVDSGSGVSEAQGCGGGGSEARLPCIVRVLNLVLFGGGRHWAVPLLLGGGLCAADLWLASTQYVHPLASSAWMWTNIAGAGEVAVNAYFGYGFCRDARLTQLMREVAAPHGVAERDAMRALGRWAWAAVAAAAVVTGWAAPWLSTATGQAVDFDWACSAFSCTYFFLGVFYLCALWMWTNWLFRRAGRSVASRGVTASSVAQRQASSAVFGLLDAMRSASRVWAVNHGVRAVTTVAFAEAMVQLIVQSKKSATPDPTVAARAFTLAALLFFVVVATAAAPGHVTTDFYEAVLDKLAELDSGGSSGSVGDDGCGAASGGRGDTPTALMQRIAAAREGKGMHFAGVPMTVQKALTGATVVFYLTKDFAT